MSGQLNFGRVHIYLSRTEINSIGRVKQEEINETFIIHTKRTHACIHKHSTAQPSNGNDTNHLSTLT